MQTLKVKDNDIKFITKLINLNNMKYDDSNIKNLDDKLKFLIILYIYQLKIKAKINYNYLKNAFLLSSEFLSQLNYDSLFNTLNNIIDINKEFKSDIESYIIKEKEILYKLNDIESYIIKEKEILYKLNKYLNNEIIFDIEKNINIIKLLYQTKK